VICIGKRPGISCSIAERIEVNSSAWWNERSVRFRLALKPKRFHSLSSAFSLPLTSPPSTCPDIRSCILLTLTSTLSRNVENLTHLDDLDFNIDHILDFPYTTMAEQKMYVPPHRRSTIPSSSRFTTRSSTTSRLESLSPARQPRQTSFEGTTSYCQHLHLQSPSVTRSSVLVESQSVRRGYGRFGGPPPALSQTTEGRSITALVSDTEHDEEEDLDSASAVYSNSTNLARTISSFEPEIDLLTRTHTPLPTREWASVDIRVAPLPPKPSGPLPLPVPLLGKIGPLHSHGNSTRPLAERIGRLYIPPSARFANGLYPSRDDTSFWQSQTLNGGKIQPPRDDSRWWQKENLRRQKINFHSSKTTSQPGPSRRCMIQPTFSQVAVLFHHLGEKIDSFKMTDLEVRKGEGISGVKYAGSYKWIEGEEGVPTLAVPGKLNWSL